MRALLMTLLLTVANHTQAIGIPDEYRASGGYSLGLSHAAMVADNGVAAVVLNPAMIALARDYRISLGYNWPATGRGFYQVGIVDGKTAKVAAGVLYTAFTKIRWHGFLHHELDSPIARRGWSLYLVCWARLLWASVGSMSRVFSSTRRCMACLP